MPRRYVPKYKRKAKTVRRATKPRQKFKFSKGLTRSVVPFTRERETHVRLDTLAGIDDGAGTYINMIRTDDGGIVGRISVRLNNLTDFTDFTNLFKEYKLNYLKLTFIPAGNVAGTRADTRAPPTMIGNKNILIRTMLNRTGDMPDAGDEVSDWNQIQAKKQWVLVQDRPTTITCKLNQMGLVNSGSAFQTVYGVQKPKYISTNMTQVNHYGITLRFDSIDGTPITEANGNIWPQFRVISKIYFTCRGVA